MLRTHTCNELGIQDIGKDVTLCGWVHRRRDHGGIIFIDLRDRYGLTQVVADPTVSEEIHTLTDTARPEYVVKVTGTVRKRPDGMVNAKIATGEIEILIKQFEILNKALTPPFEIDQEYDIHEDLRLKYRYLDLRRERMKNNIIMRHKVIKMIRDFMDSKNFLEIETPILIKGTPEGSREYVVPSRLYPGKFFVLPQSPQQLKQLLMVAGMDRYFQIARCFRDEDQRGDRQPEFTQLDVEMSFVDENDVMGLTEELMILLTEKLVPHKKIMWKPFKRISWQTAMEEYGSDKPDLRFEMKIADVSDIAEKTKFEVFTRALNYGGVVKALCVPGGAAFTRKEIDKYTEIAKGSGAHGLAYIQVTTEGPKSAIIKFFSDEEVKALLERTKAKPGDIIFFGADSFKTACTSLGQVRLACADHFKLRDKDKFAYLWIYDFPLFEWNEEEKRFESSHHPFTNVQDQDYDLVFTDPSKAKGKHYDLVLNGYELAGGSIRIHESRLQSRVFEVLGFTKEDAERRFGHLLRAFEYGAPPHGGIAPGIDRILMLFQDEPNIREVIPFPKDQKAKDLMLDAPSALPEAQIAEMHIAVMTNNQAPNSKQIQKSKS